MGLKSSFAVICLFVCATASFIYKVLDHYVHSRGRFRET